MVTAFLSILLLMLGLYVSVAGSFYWFTIPFFVHVVMNILLSVKFYFYPSAELKQKKDWLFRLLPITAIFPMFLWPGGDDGPGMAWMLFVGGGSLFAVVDTFLASFFSQMWNRDTEK